MNILRVYCVKYEYEIFTDKMFAFNQFLIKTYVKYYI